VDGTVSIYRRLRAEDGMSLPELLVAMILMVIVMTATLTTLDSSGKTRTLNDQRNDAVERVRVSADQIVRQLRNLASPSNTTPNAIDRAQGLDLAFRTFDPTKKLIRYCVSDDPSNPNIIYQMIQSSSATVAATAYSSCGTSTAGWSIIRVVATNVVNQRSGVPVFTYNGDTSNTPTITNIRIQLVVDVNSALKAPDPTRISSGAALRNQNQRPTATFTYTHTVNSRKFVLNGTSSSDPEDRTLIYTWYAGQTINFATDGAHQIGVGAVLTQTFSPAMPNGSATNWYFRLIVSDSNLTDQCPSTAGSTANCPTAGPFTPFS
jgi:prepilin-type N-terminal cleavage/methylation domain-containing protein